MSASNPNSAIFMSDTLNQIKACLSYTVKIKEKANTRYRTRSTSTHLVVDEKPWKSIANMVETQTLTWPM